MKIYYHDNQPGESHLPHDSGTEILAASLSELGILYYSFPPSSPNSASLVEDVATSRHYTNRDEISSSKLIASVGPTAYEQILKTFFNEHMHEDEEIRYILKGSGYFDVRDADDKWVRIKAETGDFLVLPAGIYHRFTLDESKDVSMMRLYQNAPKWEALNRTKETEDNEYRKNYLVARSNLIRN